jgi:hypothetical protein
MAHMEEADLAQVPEVRASLVLAGGETASNGSMGAHPLIGCRCNGRTADYKGEKREEEEEEFIQNPTRAIYARRDS